MMHYSIKIVIFQFVLLLGYKIFFRKETVFTFNRIYLLLAPVVGLVLPFIKIPALQVNSASLTSYLLPEVWIGNSPVLVAETADTSSIYLWLTGIWIAGSLLSFALFVIKYKRIMRLKKSGRFQKIDTHPVIVLPDSKDSFTFLNTLFIGGALSQPEKHIIMQHELVHKQQKHGLDLLYFEMLRVFFWFNPLIYLFQKELKMLHEYIADHYVIKQAGKKEYYQNLLSQVFYTSEISFINTFFNYSLIRLPFGFTIAMINTAKSQVKNRIVMLQKSNQKPNKLKYLLIFPILGMMLFYASCTQESKPETDSVSDKIAELKTALENQTVSEEEKKQLTELLKNLNSPTPPFPPTPFNKNEVPFSAIDKAPVYPGCSGSNEELKRCFSEKLSAFVNENFDISLAKRLNVTGKQRITVIFKIDKEGNITNAKARAPHPDLAAHAVSIVESLPKLKPGENAGKKVGVLYALPILFDVKE